MLEIPFHFLALSCIRISTVSSISCGRWRKWGDGGKRPGGEKDPPHSPREPQPVWRCAGSTSPTLCTAITPQSENKCHFNSGCSSDPVISPPLKGKLPHFRCKLSIVTPSPSYPTLWASKQKRPKQDHWWPSLATSHHLLGLWSQGSRLPGEL